MTRFNVNTSSKFKNTLKTIAGAAVAGTLALSLSGCGNTATTTTNLGTTPDDAIRIGIVNIEDDYWRVFEEAAEAEGIYIDFVNFSEFPLVNQALVDGDLDMNQFQHLQFLGNFNVATGANLVPIGATAVYPLGLYSQRWTTPDDFPEGGVVAIPNDPTNQARALLVLQEADLLKLVNGGDVTSTPFDIIADESRVTVLPVDAAMTAASLPDVDGSIVNNSMIAQVGLTLADAIFSDDPDSSAAEPYINVWVTRPEDANEPNFIRLTELFHETSGVIEGLIESSSNTAAIRNNSRTDLQRILAEIEESLSNN